MSRAISGTNRLSHIDGLRAIAALLVVAHHLLGTIYAASGQHSWIADGLVWLRETVDFGRTGVNLFFIISGYVVGQSISRYAEKNTRLFVVSRFFRLYPVYWLSVLVAWLYASGPVDAGPYLINLTMLQEFLGVPDVQGVYWTLAVELVFYATSVLLFWLGLLHRPVAMQRILAILVAYLLGATLVRAFAGIALPYGWPMFTAFFIGGIVLRQRDDRGASADRRFWAVLSIYLLVALIASVAVFHDPTTYQKTWHAEFAATAIAAVTFVLTVHFRPRLRLLAAVGLISYSVYLFHVPVSGAIMAIMAPYGLVAQLPWPISILLVTTGILAFSWLTYVLVERPGVRIGRSVQQIIRNGVATANQRQGT